MFRNILLSAGLAGVVAALLLTVAQELWITPLILQTETYEEAAAAQAHLHAATAAAAEHHHEAEAWTPANGWERRLYSLAANIATGVGFALVLTGVYVLGRRPAGAAQGLLYGLAGFAVFFVAPGLGLPPELPGSEVAELGLRQRWWLGTAVATAAGLALIFLQRSWWLRLAGAAMLVAPHLVGAPHPAIEGSLAPEALQQHFRIVTTVCNAVFWLLLGALTAAALRKFSAREQ